MGKRLVTWLMVAMMALLLVSPAAAKGKQQAIPAPTPLSDGTGDISIQGDFDAPGTPGTLYVGAIPPNVDYAKPVLLFVHGKGGSSQVWWTETAYHGVNDMYTYAYNNGYRTAFVDLYAEGTMWTNGSLLNSMIDRVRNHYGVSKVTIIAHSKGGVDSNAALVHYGASGKVSRVITLGTPHWGTPLADMAYSSWTWWLAALMGQTTEATYVMQTGYMNYFRSVTDGRDATPFFTLSGYKCGPVFSALWYGCMAIGGEDDGVVGVSSARIPGGTHLRTGYWDHDEIRMGSRTWSTFAPRIQTATTNAQIAEVLDGRMLAAANNTDAGRGQAAKPGVSPGNLILRGGEVTGQGSAPAFPLESGVQKVSFTFIASSPDFSATLTGPDGSTHTVTMTAQVEAAQVFGGAYTGTVEVATPAAGQWSISTSAAERTGYLMMAGVESDLLATLDAGQGVAAPGNSRALTVGFAGARTPASSQAQAWVTLAGQRPGSAIAMQASANGHRAAAAVPGQAGIYNTTVTVTGTLEDGSSFERTLVSSFAAVPAAQRGNWR